MMIPDTSKRICNLSIGNRKSSARV